MDALKMFRLIGSIGSFILSVAEEIMIQTMLFIPVVLVALVICFVQGLIDQATGKHSNLPLCLLACIVIGQYVIGGTILLRRFKIILPVLTDLVIWAGLIPALNISRWVLLQFKPEVAGFEVWYSRALNLPE